MSAQTLVDLVFGVVVLWFVFRLLCMWFGGGPDDEG